MDKKLLHKYFSSLFFLLFLTLFINIQVSANENEIRDTQNDEGVIIPEVTTSEVKYVKTLSTSSTSTTKSFSTVSSAVNYIMSEAKNFKTTVTFEYIGELPNFAVEIDKALTKPSNDYVHGTLESWSFQAVSSGKKSKVTITLKYILGKTQEDYVTKKVKEIANSLSTPKMTDFDKVLAVNNYVVNLSTYSDKTKSSPYHVYTLLNERKGVCQAYALLTYRLLTEMGVETRYVVGEANGIGHAWNSVKIDGTWYHLDTTWNDIWPSKFSSYKYFLVSSNKLAKDHIWDKKLYPVATDERFSYLHTISKGMQHNGYIYNLVNGVLYEVNPKTGAKKVIDKSVTSISNITNGTLNYLVGKENKSYSIPPFKLTILPVAAVNVTITNNFGKPDTITFKNLNTNATYKIYKDASKTTLIDSFKPSSTSINRTIKQLSAIAGAIYITVTVPGYDESSVTKVSYKAERLPSLTAKNIIVSNNYNAADKIVLKGLTKGYTYTIYTDSTLKKKLTSFTATSTTKTITIKQLGIKSGSLYVVISKSGYLTSAATKVTYKAEKLPALPAKNVKITNKVKSDKIVFKGLTKGYRYTVYYDSKLKKKLTSFSATSKTKTVTVKQVGKKAGAVYVVVSKPGYISSNPTKVYFKAQSK